MNLLEYYPSKHFMRAAEKRRGWTRSHNPNRLVAPPVWHSLDLMKPCDNCKNLSVLWVTSGRIWNQLPKQHRGKLLCPSCFNKLKKRKDNPMKEELLERVYGFLDETEFMPGKEKHIIRMDLTIALKLKDTYGLKFQTANMHSIFTNTGKAIVFVPGNGYMSVYRGYEHISRQEFLSLLQNLRRDII
jgi:hypothetical protein